MAEASTVPGRGRKHCPGCQLYIGVRSSVCPECGHNFKGVESSPKEVKETKPLPPKREALRQLTEETEKVGYKELEEDSEDCHLFAVAIPSGLCPVELTASDEETVTFWAQQVRRHCRASKSWSLTDEALVYWVRQFFPYGTAEYKQAISNFKE